MRTGRSRITLSAWVGLLLGTVMPWVPADKLGPIDLAAFFQPFVMIAVPNLFFVSALLFAVGALTRKLFAVYVTGILLLALAGFPVLAQAGESHAAVTVYAAASLTEALQEIAAAYETTHAVDIRLSFASSGILARQIDAGAPAQLFAAADARWMDFLQQRQRIDAGSRRDLLGNTLVLIAGLLALFALRYYIAIVVCGAVALGLVSIRGANRAGR